MKFVEDYKIAYVSCFVIALSVYVALYRLEFHSVILRFTTDSPGNRTGGAVFESMSVRVSVPEDIDRSNSLQDNYYRDSCPSSDRIIRNTLKQIYEVKPSIAPSLIRLLFHDCFIEGCDASVLLDSDESLVVSEKEASPNLSLKGFDVIHAIKSELENVCPGVVSCADIIVLAARESVKLAGGPRYPLQTGRKDSLLAFKDKAERELPSPHASLSEILASFHSKGFNERETVSLSGAHSIGITHCTFFEDRLYNFSGTGKHDPELNLGFLKELKTKCPFSASSSSPSISPGSGTSLAPSLHASGYYKSHRISSVNRSDGVIDLSFNNEGGEAGFGTRFYKRLIENKGVMFSDQQLTSREDTERWVRAYASDPQLFRHDFAFSMIKMSNHRVLIGPLGQVRTNCSKVLPRN